MKVKNEYILIKKRNKEIKIQNTILLRYIKNIIQNQLSPENRANLVMTTLFLKFDRPLSFNSSTDLQKNDFDIYTTYNLMSTEISDSETIINYLYELNHNTKDIKTESWIASIEPYLNRLITAIGFGAVDQGELTVYACVDTSNYGLYIDDLTEVFSVSRKDRISTDAIFYSNNKKIKGALHLFEGQYIYNHVNFPEIRLVGILKSVGVGTTFFNMNQEIKINDKDLIVSDDKILINKEFEIKHTSEGLLPDIDLYPNDSQYPERIINIPLFPNKNVYPEIEQYPFEAPYQYMQLKYEIYSINTINGIITNTGTYYLLSKAIGEKQKIKINIKYEEA